MKIEQGKCPIAECIGDHDCCEFAAGTLGCVRYPCANPHHQYQWVGVRPSLDRPARNLLG